MSAFASSRLAVLRLLSLSARPFLLRLLLYLLATALLVLGMQYVGIAVSLFVYLLLVPWLVEKHTFLSSLKLAGVTTLVIYLIFHVWLKVPMTILNFLNI